MHHRKRHSTEKSITINDATGFKHIRLVHDNASSHTSTIVTIWPHNRIPHTLPRVISFCFRNWNHSLLGGNINAIHHSLLLCWNQRTVMPSRSDTSGKITLTLMEPIVSSLCHHCRAKISCSSMQSSQVLHCWLTNFKFLSWFPKIW